MNLLPSVLDCCGVPPLLRQHRALLALVELGAHLGHEPIEFMQVDVGQDRGDDPTLRRAAIGGMQRPVFDISRFQHPPDQIDEFLIVDPFPEEIEQDFFLDVVILG